MQFEQDIDSPFRHVLVSRKHRLPSFFVKAEAKHECITKETVFRRTNLTSGQIPFYRERSGFVWRRLVCTFCSESAPLFNDDEH